MSEVPPPMSELPGQPRARGAAAGRARGRGAGADGPAEHRLLERDGRHDGQREGEQPALVLERAAELAAARALLEVAPQRVAPQRRRP